MKGMLFEFEADEEDGRKRNCWGVRSYLNAIGKMSYFCCDMFAEQKLVRANRGDALHNKTE